MSRGMELESLKGYQGTGAGFICEMEGIGVRPAALGQLKECLKIYCDNGLLPGGEDKPLQCICRNADECWKGMRGPEDHPEQAGISAPWIGCGYAESRVLIVATNFNDFGGLDANWTACRSHMNSLSAGKRGAGGRAFAAGAMRYLNLALASHEDCLPKTGWEDPPHADLAELMNRCAMVQAVKCAPGSARSDPSGAMRRNCPPFLLKEEIAILAPRVVLVLGRTTVRDPIREMLLIEWESGEHPGSMERDWFRMEPDGERIQMFSLNHPSGRPNNIAKSLCEMHESLVKTPLV